MDLQMLAFVDDLSHLEQADGFSPVLVLSCLFTSPLTMNDMSQLEQADGFLLCGSFCAFSDDHCLLMTCCIWNKQMTSLLCGSFSAGFF